MNAEYLLDAIGRLDDDLIQEAEHYRRPKARYAPLLGLAASFAVVILLGYFAMHIGGMGGGAAPSLSNDAASPGGWSGGGAPNTAEGGDSGEPYEPEAQLESALPFDRELSDSPQASVSGAVFVRGAQDNGSYILTGEVLEALPGDAEPVLIGTLLALYPDSPSPCTTVEEYVGLNLWAENDGTDLLYAVYVELPEGGFARAELAEP